MGEWILVYTFERTCVYNKHILYFANSVYDEVLYNLFFAHLSDGSHLCNRKLWAWRSEAVYSTSHWSFHVAWKLYLVIQKYL